MYCFLKSPSYRGTSKQKTTFIPRMCATVTCSIPTSNAGMENKNQTFLIPSQLGTWDRSIQKIHGQPTNAALLHNSTWLTLRLGSGHAWLHCCCIWDVLHHLRPILHCKGREWKREADPDSFSHYPQGPNMNVNISCQVSNVQMLDSWQGTHTCSPAVTKHLLSTCSSQMHDCEVSEAHKSHLF